MHQLWVDYIRKTHDVKKAKILRDKLMPYLCASVQAKDFQHDQEEKRIQATKLYNYGS